MKRKETCSSRIKVCREGKKVVPNMKRTAKTAIKGIKKSYPYK